LDCLPLQLHIETACRRGGPLGLRVGDVDTKCCSVRLWEEGGTMRWQPITATLAAALHSHAQHRGAHRPTDTLLRYADHRPLTARHDVNGAGHWPSA
jgi:hypothetical protein